MQILTPVLSLRNICQEWFNFSGQITTCRQFQLVNYYDSIHSGHELIARGSRWGIATGYHHFAFVIRFWCKIILLHCNPNSLTKMLANYPLHLLWDMGEGQCDKINPQGAGERRRHKNRNPRVFINHLGSERVMVSDANDKCHAHHLPPEADHALS